MMNFNFLKRFNKKKARGFEILQQYEKWFIFEEVKVPARKTHRSAGYDIAAIGEYVIPPNGKVVIDTGLTAFMEPDEFLAIFVRSGLAFDHNLTLQNGVAVIDSDFYGKHIRIMLRNEGTSAIQIKTGDRIAQGIFFNFLVTSDDIEHEKKDRVDGFGSTGKAA